MASSKLTTSAVLFLFLLLDLLFFTSACNYCPGLVSPPPPPPAKKQSSCPVDTLKFAVCGSVLGGLINVEWGKPPKEPCCSLVGGLADVEAALCICTALKANVLGMSVNIPVHLSLLVNYCGKNVPGGFQCA